MQAFLVQDMKLNHYSFLCFFIAVCCSFLSFSLSSSLCITADNLHHLHHTDTLNWMQVVQPHRIYRYMVIMTNGNIRVDTLYGRGKKICILHFQRVMWKWTTTSRMETQNSRTWRSEHHHHHQHSYHIGVSIHHLVHQMAVTALTSSATIECNWMLCRWREQSMWEIPDEDTLNSHPNKNPTRKKRDFPETHVFLGKQRCFSFF